MMKDNKLKEVLEKYFYLLIVTYGRKEGIKKFNIIKKILFSERKINNGNTTEEC